MRVMLSVLEAPKSSALIKSGVTAVTAVLSMTTVISGDKALTALPFALVTRDFKVKVPSAMSLET